MNTSEGWTWMHNSRKWHYFRDGKSLCRNWMLLRNPSEGFSGDMDSSDNCADCARRRAKELSKSRAVAESEVRE